MYNEKGSSKKRHIKNFFIIFVVLLIISFFSIIVGSGMSRDISEESKNAVKNAVIRCAVSCYATEGSYPKSINYLEDNYGLIINHNKYIVSYDSFSDNLLPQVKVLIKGEN